MYRLYYSPGSCAMAAHIALEEIGAPYELELISSRGAREGKATATPEYRAINPKGRVPADSRDLNPQIPYTHRSVRLSEAALIQCPDNPRKEASCSASLLLLLPL
jgi:hypothetical protein